MDKAQQALAHLDAVAYEMEIKWGIGRLTELVTPTMAARFKAQQELLDQITQTNDQQGIADAAQATVRGWQAMDQEASIKGALPVFQTKWIGKAPSGQTVTIYRMPQARLDNPDDDGSLVFTLDELLALVDGLPDLVKQVKQAGLAAQVKAVHDGKPEDIDWEKGDPLPF